MARRNDSGLVRLTLQNREQARRLGGQIWARTGVVSVPDRQNRFDVVGRAGD